MIAVLLDEFIECITEEKEAAAAKLAKDKELENAAVRVQGFMDPILQNLSRFTTQEDFFEKIDKLFAMLDKDGGGALDYLELRDGLKAMKFTPAVIITEEVYIYRSMTSSASTAPYAIQTASSTPRNSAR